MNLMNARNFLILLLFSILGIGFSPLKAAGNHYEGIVYEASINKVAERKPFALRLSKSKRETDANLLWAILVPPVGVYLHEGAFSNKVLISLALYGLGLLFFGIFFFCIHSIRPAFYSL